MAAYEQVFDAVGLREWCDADKTDAPMSMTQLLAQAKGEDAAADGPALPFPSLDVLHEACDQISQTRDLTASLETGFLAVRDELKFFLDPLTQPLSCVAQARFAGSDRSRGCSTVLWRCFNRRPGGS